MPRDDLTSRRHFSRDFSENAKAFRDFAEGGHVQADKDLAKMMEADAANARGHKLEMDSFDAMFGGPTKLAQTENTKDMKLIRMDIDDRGATRTVYRETYTPPVLEPKKTGKGKETSLLDL